MIYIKGQIWELAKLQEVRNIEWTINSKIANFWSQTFDFPNWKKISNFLYFSIWTIPKTLKLENSKNLQFGKLKKKSIWKLSKIFISENFENCRFGKFQKSPICKIPQICNLENWKNFQCGEFEKFPISKTKNIPNFAISKKHQISKIVQFRRITNFRNTTICKTTKIPWIYNFINYHIFWMFE